MDDLERFGSRLEASLRRLAEEIPTEVEADVYASDVVRLAGRRHRLAVPWGRIDLALPRPLRLALVLAALVALALGMLLVAQGVRPAVRVGPVHGEMHCPGDDAFATLATLAAVGSTCRSDLGDPAVSGSVRLGLRPSTAFAGTLSRAGRMSIDASGATWNGPARIIVDPDGLMAGDATLVGDGVGAGHRLHVRLISIDGADWGVFGTIERLQ